MNVSVLYDFNPELEKAKAEYRTKQEKKTRKPRGWRLWLKKMGVAGFVFFTVKGLLWLIIPTVAAKLLA